MAKQVISTDRSRAIPGAVRARARNAVEDLNEGLTRSMGAKAV